MRWTRESIEAAEAAAEHRSRVEYRDADCSGDIDMQKVLDAALAAQAKTHEGREALRAVLDHAMWNDARPIPAPGE